MNEEKELVLTLDTWLKNSGILGLVRVLGVDQDKSINLRSNEIRIPLERLENFEEKYFSYLIEIHEKNTTFYKVVKKLTELIDYSKNQEDFSKDDIKKKYNERIDYIKIKMQSNSYQSAYDLISGDGNDFDFLTYGKGLKKIKNPEEAEAQFDNLVLLKNKLDDDIVRRYILAKNVMYDVIAPFWTGVSILHNSKNKVNMYAQFKGDFILPIIEDSKREKEKDKYRCFTCDNSILKLSKPYAYGMGWINSIGADESKKSSHFWNHQSDAYICPICNLIYACIPLGFNVYMRKGLFINNNESIADLINFNSSGRLKTFADSNIVERENYFEILRSIDKDEIQKREIDNIQVVKFSDDKYKFHLLTKEIIRILKVYHSEIEDSFKVVKIDGEFVNLFDELMMHLYLNRNLFNLIYRLLKTKVDGAFVSDKSIKTLININNDMLGNISEVKEMERELIEKFRIYGWQLKEAYLRKKQENKVPGLSYRLLNALKTKNDKSFLDTVINMYMYHGEGIPKNFITILEDKEKFQTAGYAFVLGLDSVTMDKEKGGNENEKH